jgi:malonyl-CoA decarboxylase
MTLCAHYLARERKGGYPLDPVAHFHLKNGASLWRVNWMGDRSVRGLQRSLGMMVNYCYNTRDIADNGRRFRVEQSIATSDHIDSLLHK